MSCTACARRSSCSGRRLWALVLGFGLSGAVQAFVSKEQMQRVMGDHRPGLGRAGVGLRDGVVVVLLRGDGDGQVAVPEGRRLRHRHGLHVRLHQPRRRARRRAADPHGLAVRGGRVRGRADHDRAPRALRRLRPPSPPDRPGAAAPASGNRRRPRPPGHGRCQRRAPRRSWSGRRGARS